MVGGGRTLFFVMHENDFDFMLPLISHAARPTVLLYGADISHHPGYSRIGSVTVDLTGGALHDGVSPAADVAARALRRVRLNAAAARLARSERRRALTAMAGRLAAYLRGVDPADVATVVFDHGTDDGKLTLVPILRAWAGGRVPIVSVPHGVSCITNRMQRLSDLRPPVDQSQHEMFDLVVANDEWHHQQFVDGGVSPAKLRTIESLRYTVRWQNELRRMTARSGSAGWGAASKPVCLVLITKFQANIFREELLRCLRIILATRRIQLVLKPHPRGRGEARLIRRMLSSDVMIANGHVIPALEAADFVVAMPSSAIYDAVLMKKPVLYPAFATSSMLNPDLARQVIALRTPDEFYEAVQPIANGALPAPRSEETASYAEILAQWRQVISLDGAHVGTPVETISVS